MNIFAIDNDPEQAAKWHVDRHMKMLLEFCQMACSNFRFQGIEAPYRSTHVNHPSTVWLRTSYKNFQWGIALGHAIVEENYRRFGKIHKSKAVLDWVEDNLHKLSFDSFNLTPFSLAIRENAECRKLAEFDESDPVNCYRLFYKYDKKHLHFWKIPEHKPDWI